MAKHKPWKKLALIQFFSTWETAPNAPLASGSEGIQGPKPEIYNNIFCYFIAILIYYVRRGGALSSIASPAKGPFSITN